MTMHMFLWMVYLILFDPNNSAGCSLGSYNFFYFEKSNKYFYGKTNVQFFIRQKMAWHLTGITEAKLVNRMVCFLLYGRWDSPGKWRKYDVLWSPQILARLRNAADRSRPRHHLNILLPIQITQSWNKKKKKKKVRAFSFEGITNCCLFIYFFWPFKSPANTSLIYSFLVGGIFGLISLSPYIQMI